jgi:hypothetical protein
MIENLFATHSTRYDMRGSTGKIIARDAYFDFPDLDKVFLGHLRVPFDDELFLAIRELFDLLAWAYPTILFSIPHSSIPSISSGGNPYCSATGYINEGRSKLAIVYKFQIASAGRATRSY